MNVFYHDLCRERKGGGRITVRICNRANPDSNLHGRQNKTGAETAPALLFAPVEAISRLLVSRVDENLIEGIASDLVELDALAVGKFTVTFRHGCDIVA